MMKKILLVEDNEMHWVPLSRRLSSRGYEVVIATDGEEGVHRAQSEHPDVILMDMSLPKLSGWEASRAIKSNDETCHIPIIAITAHVLDDARAKALAAGCDDYSPKPVDFITLMDQIWTLTQQ